MLCRVEIYPQVSGRHKCPKCGKRFAEKCQLKRHQSIHKRRRFTCQECGKKFIRKEHLRRHSVLHNSEVNDLEWPFFSLKYILRSSCRGFACSGFRTKLLENLQSYSYTVRIRILLQYCPLGTSGRDTDRISPLVLFLLLVLGQRSSKKPIARLFQIGSG